MFRPRLVGFGHNMGPALSFGDQQAALSFLVSQITHIEAEVYRIQYPDIQYPDLIPVDTSAPEWVKSITFFSMDRTGRAEWLNHNAKDIAIADLIRDKHESTVEMAGVGYRYTLEEIGQAMMMQINLTTEKAEAARRAYEEFVDDFAIRGDTTRNMTGLINDPNVLIVNAPTDGSDGGSTFDNKTGAQITRDLNSLLSGIYTDSRTIEMADTLLLPVGVFTDLATVQMSTASDISVLEWFQRYNVFTATTGQPLMIRGVRGLETADASGFGRAVAYRRDPQVLKMHIPMVHRFLPVWQTGPLIFDVPGIFRIGGVEIRRPSAVRYLDGVSEEPYE